MTARTTDPALTLAWLLAPKPEPVSSRFVIDRGRVRYARWMQSSKTHKRLAYMLNATCEIAGCEATEATASLVFDHCHRHGWIRAVLCNSHNVRIAGLEDAWLEYGVDLSPTPYWAILMNCLDCAHGHESAMSQDLDMQC